MAQISFGRLIADARKARDLTQEEVAAVLGMTRANYSQIETGARKEVLSPEVATKLARLLNAEAACKDYNDGCHDGARRVYAARVSEQAATAFRVRAPGLPLPDHDGFNQLRIILQKARDYDRCEEICRVAHEQGWAGRWEVRRPKGSTTSKPVTRPS